MCAEDVSVSRRTGFQDDFWYRWDSVFVNDFLVTSSLCAEKMSASAIELGFLDDLCVPGS